MSRYRIYMDDTGSPQSVDCNCACPAPTSWLASVAVPSAELLQCHPQVQQITLDDEHTIAFVPSLSRVVVLNQAAQALLRRFGEPRTLTRDEQEDAETVAAIQELAAAYLLLPPQQCDTLPTPPEADELSAWLHVTNACNLRCTYCYVDKSNEAMSAETSYAAVDAIMRSAHRYGYTRVLLKYAGGEASLNLPLVAEIHRYAQNQCVAAGVRDLDAVVLSNGVGLTRAKLEQIHNLGIRLMISLDGSAAVHDAQRPRLGGQGSYAAVIASIERARQIGVPLTISVTVTGQSITGLPEVVRWLLERQLHFTLNFYRDNECSQQRADLQLEEQHLIEGMRAAYAEIERNLPAYSLLGCLLDRTNLQAPHQRTCPVGQSYLVITQRGEVARCQMQLDQPITTVYADDPLGMIRADRIGVQNLPVDTKLECSTCVWKYWCAGGCAISTFRATGRYDVRSPNCGIYKALYPDVIRLEGLRLLQQANPSAGARP